MDRSGIVSLLVAALAAALSSACSNTSDVSAGGLSWQECDPDTVPAKVVEELDGRVACAVLQVPLDHADPRKGTIDFALLRVAAAKPAERRGAIFTNPGGPGGDGIGLGLYLGRLFAIADPATPIGSRLRALSDRYDVIGFSPRGVGSSTKLECRLDATYATELLPTSDGSPANLDAILHNQELDARACRRDPLTPFINTDATARDMDLARRAMGDERLSYLGYSYGTWLGIWYASLFPDHVDRMMIDSTVDYGEESLTGNGQAEPLQLVLDRFVIPWAAASDAKFGLGDSDEEIRAIFGSLPVELQTVLSDRLYGLLFSQERAGRVVEELGAAKGVGAILREHPGASDTEMIAATATQRYAPDAAVDEAMRRNAAAQMEGFLALAHRIPIPVAIGDDNSVNKAVTCNDGPSPTDPAFWNLQLETLRVTAPAYFHDRFELNCTDTWSGPTVTKPDVAGARRVPNILMAQDQFDPATPLPGALRTYALLGNASLIYNTRSYSHGVFPSDDACVDLAVADFFLDDEIPPRFVVECIGRGLLNEAEAAPDARVASTRGLPPELQAVSRPGAVGRTSDGFADADAARAAMRDVRALVVDAATLH